MHEKFLAFYNAWIEALECKESLRNQLIESLGIFNQNDKIIIAYDSVDGILFLNCENLDRHYPKCYNLTLKATSNTSLDETLSEIVTLFN